MSRPHIAELAVKDLALVSELRVELAPGRTVLTGETGAGKSMLGGALLAESGGALRRAGTKGRGSRGHRSDARSLDLGDLVLGSHPNGGREWKANATDATRRR